MFILGISAFGHDSAAALIYDGKLIAAAEEERFSRKKHDGGFPYHAIDFCLSHAGITLSEVRYIGFYHNPWLAIDRRFLHMVRYFPRTLSFFTAQTDNLHGWYQMYCVPNYLQNYTGSNKTRTKLVYLNHHLAHAASTFFASPFDEAVILSADGMGEWITTYAGIGTGNRIHGLLQINFPHSLGLFYETITMYLGFNIHQDEYKVMGLSAYGEPIHTRLFENILKTYDNGQYRLNLNYFQFHLGRIPYFSSTWIKTFGQPRKNNYPIISSHADLAASAQQRLETVLCNILDYLYRRTKLPNLCLAGGVALNCVANSKILERSPFQRVFIQPAAYDAGTALGAALYIYHNKLGYPRGWQMQHSAWGPEYHDTVIQSTLKKYNLKYKKCPDISTSVANLLADGKIIGWFQNKMEFGPRALGNRSILADPRRTQSKEIITRYIKQRESFQPFAPSVLIERQHEYFELTIQSPFMLFVSKVKPTKKELIPAVVHVDDTARIQSVCKEHLPLFWRLITGFYRITGIPMVLNTSFNQRGEPIVCTPEDAIRCFLNTKIDYLAISNFLVQK